MEIHQVLGELVLTCRRDGMGHMPVKALRSVSGAVNAAMDPIGVKKGDWVFTIANSAARDAAGTPSLPKPLTDLTVSGIIDNWES